MTTYYRIQGAGRDPQALLDPANWVSRVWFDATVTCPRCNGSAEYFEAQEVVTCTVCGGSGVRNLSQMPRRGVSACESIEDLAEYFDGHSGLVSAGSVVVELEGELADDDDFDADAVLVFPSAIVSVTPVTEFSEFAEMVD